MGLRKAVATFSDDADLLIDANARHRSVQMIERINRGRRLRITRRRAVPIHRNRRPSSFTGTLIVSDGHDAPFFAHHAFNTASCDTQVMLVDLKALMWKG